MSLAVALILTAYCQKYLERVACSKRAELDAPSRVLSKPWANLRGYSKVDAFEKVRTELLANGLKSIRAIVLLGHDACEFKQTLSSICTHAVLGAPEARTGERKETFASS